MQMSPSTIGIPSTPPLYKLGLGRIISFLQFWLPRCLFFKVDHRLRSTDEVLSSSVETWVYEVSPLSPISHTGGGRDETISGSDDWRTGALCKFRNGMRLARYQTPLL